MAKNIFVGGDWKKYRDNLRNFEKRKDKLSTYDFMREKKILDEEFNRLTKLCSQPDAQKKISEITVGILRKNKKISAQIKNLNSQIEKLNSHIEHLYHQLLNSVNPPSPKKFSHVANSQQKNFASIVSVITEPLSRDSKDVAVNAKITDKNLDMPTKRNLMSDLKKKEQAHKKLLGRI